VSSALLSPSPASAPRATHLRLVARTRGETTLDEIIVRAWEGLTATATATASCPICDGTLGASASSGRIVAACAGCGSSLS